jgi:hypothetical protein
MAAVKVDRTAAKYGLSVFDYDEIAPVTILIRKTMAA